MLCDGHAQTASYSVASQCRSQCRSQCGQDQFGRVEHRPYWGPEAWFTRLPCQNISFRWISGARGETRTLTPVKAGDFESPASTIPPLGPLAVLLASVARGFQSKMQGNVIFQKSVHRVTCQQQQHHPKRRWIAPARAPVPPVTGGRGRFARRRTARPIRRRKQATM